MNRLHLQLAVFLILSIMFTAVEVFMPAVAVAGIVPNGSRIWMTISAANNIAPPDANGNQFVATAAGPAAPVSIPLDTWTDPRGPAFGYLTSSADASSDITAHATLYTNSGDDVFLAINDTYTVHGTASGSFPITTTLHITGSYGTVPQASFGNLLSVENAALEIGTFHPEATTDQFVIDPFPSDSLNPTVAQVHQGQTGVVGDPQTFPLDVQVSFTKMVSVNDVFDIAYGIDVNIIGYGQLDMSHSGAISFDLPPGVYLTSALGQTFGVPEPSSILLAALGLVGLMGWGWRARKNHSH